MTGRTTPPTPNRAAMRRAERLRVELALALSAVVRAWGAVHVETVERDDDLPEPVIYCGNSGLVAALVQLTNVATDAHQGFTGDELVPGSRDEIAARRDKYPPHVRGER